MAATSENVLSIRIQASGAAAVKAEFDRVNAALKASEARAEATRKALASIGQGLRTAATTTARAGMLALAAGITAVTAAVATSASGNR